MNQAIQVRRLFNRLLPSENPTQRDLTYGRLWLMRNGVPSQAMDTLAAGPFLAACALTLGASNLIIGLLAAIPHLIQFAQLLGVYLVERYRTRRLICVLGGSAARLMYPIMIVAVLLPDETLALGLLVAAVILRYSFGAIVTTAWSAWIPDLVPLGRRSQFIARRLRLMAIVGIGMSFLAAGLVDIMSARFEDGARYAYALLFAGALVFGLYSLYCMVRMTEPKMGTAEPRFDIAKRLASPFKDENFRRLMLFLGSWNFAVNLASPFFMVYMLTRLQLELTLITVFMVLSQAAHVMVLRSWGRIADRFSNKSVLAVSGPLFIACIFAWTFTTFPERHILTIPLLIVIHVLTGVATAGVTLASSAIGMKLAPPGQAASYLSASSIVNSTAAGIAPIVGGLCADFFVNRQLSLIVHWTAPSGVKEIPALILGHWDFFFILAVVLGLYSLHRLALVREVGEVSEHIVVSELLLDAKRAVVRSFSSVAGLRSVSEIPAEILGRALGRHRRRRPRPNEEAAREATPQEGETGR
ncbi:MAG: MFS transporter [Rhodospirillales bacterium]|nr:MFS transporter [Rhodospirillales bacterium]